MSNESDPSRPKGRIRGRRPRSVASIARVERQRLHGELRARLFGEQRPAVRIGGYEVERKLGQGSSGTVFAVRGPDGQRYALKLVESGDPRSLARLRREGRALSALVHPHIVRMHDVGTHDKAVYVVLDLVEGESLRSWLAKERPWSEIVACLLPVLEALAAAHERGILHRDLKPDNILVEAPSHAWLLDFGLAKPLPDSDAQGLTHMSQALTGTGDLLGTVGYIAPEHLLGHPVDARADQYAAAVVLWEALYGEPPYTGHTVVDIGLAALKGNLCTPAGTAVPASVETVLRKSLRVEPHERYPSVGAMAAHLRDHLRKELRTALPQG